MVSSQAVIRSKPSNHSIRKLLPPGASRCGAPSWPRTQWGCPNPSCLWRQPSSEWGAWPRTAGQRLQRAGECGSNGMATNRPPQQEGGQARDAGPSRHSGSGGTATTVHPGCTAQQEGRQAAENQSRLPTSQRGNRLRAVAQQGDQGGVLVAPQDCGAAAWRATSNQVSGQYGQQPSRKPLCPLCVAALAPVQLIGRRFSLHALRRHALLMRWAPAAAPSVLAAAAAAAAAAADLFTLSRHELHMFRAAAVQHPQQQLPCR